MSQKTGGQVKTTTKNKKTSEDNLKLTLGRDGLIPEKYHEKIGKAARILKDLAKDKEFKDYYKEAIETVTDNKQPKDIYIRALGKMRLNLADTTRDKEVQAELRADDELTKHGGQKSPACAKVGIRDVYIRESRLKQSVKQIAGTLLHESTHLVGVSNRPWDELFIRTVNEKANLPIN